MKMPRDSKYDFYKGLLILGVIWGHVINALEYGSDVTPWIHLFLRTYDMPMFAFISGCFLKKSIARHSFAENTANKIGTIFVPAVFWDLIISVYARRIVVGASGLWYLWGSFFAMMLIIIVNKVCAGRKSFEFAGLCIAVLITHLGLFEKWNTGFLLFPMVCGYYSEQITAKIKPSYRKYMMYGVFVLFAVLLYFWKADYNVWNAGCDLTANHFAYAWAIVMRGSVGITGVLVMMKLFEKLYDTMKNFSGKVSSLILNGLIRLGSVTLELYVLQDMIVVRACAKAVRILSNRLGYNPFIFNIPFMSMILAPAAAVVLVTVIFYVQKMIKKLPGIKDIAFGFRLGKMLMKADNE